VRRWAPLVVALASLAAGPFVGCLAVLVVPGMATEKFVSEADGSVGPAFWLCLGVWGASTVLGLIAAGALWAVTPRGDARSRNAQ
jgi:hypothetical protein